MKIVVFADVPNSVLSACIDEWVKCERNRRIMKDKLINGICYEKLAEKYDLSTRQVKYIVMNESRKIALKLHF